MPSNNNTPTPTLCVEGPRERDVDRTPVGSQDTQLEQLREIQAKLNEERECLRQLQQALEQEKAGRALGKGARIKSRDVHRCIIEDAGAEQPPIFNRASKNLAAVAILLRTMP
jgi:hypothetical protein